ncbi:NAD(P)-dependent alcohol dehydrogenase [Parvibaculum sp.]|uniref:NAD(P)-dependent alcohol dehydrogenase n=1 Tax=Parvibaculum sp. TaxID=2024848 RepID=UPI001B2F6472|nr:NAD(P)-dependent alcohol dehydrogenase [Parvibaculum sp.]MBO6633548.1 NAD(P)-dependent alcohol dehydrogenase [Parvibaculum sp.]MBO6677692.1 NAD(P)-dependent alcohol dehydrogenase [Parvibaculum sp.]MBO6685380.1 NAD(P)-dependent alcohol dehydrogenase [Parvibaculum sp.]MBO6905453.1 NAD(P)-dependent alcohol dehydrogenase [Parvibaculum sp.]
MKVTAAVARAPEADFSIEELEIDEPREDEILVRVVGVGLCHTDLVFKMSQTIVPPAVFGHEGSGIVDRVGSAVTKVAPGDRVAITFRSCGECARCRKGDPAYCHTMPMLNYAGMRPDGSKALHGPGEDIASNFFGQSSFATHCLTYERNVVKVPEGFPLELAGPLGCGIQTGAGGVMRSLACEVGSSILILGGGAVGLSAVMGAAVQGCETIIVLEPHAERRRLARELGATHVLDPAEAKDLAAAVRAILPIGVDYAFDTTGIPDLLQATMGCLGPHGTFGIVGIAPPGTPMPGDLMSAVTFGHTVKGIIEGDSDPDTFIPEMIELYRQGRLPFDRLVKTYPLSEINRAIADQHDGKCVKVVLLTGQN